MRYVEVHATDVFGDIPSKKALKERLADDPYVFTFTPVSVFNSDIRDICVWDLPKDVTLQVTGPNPYTNRKWYATVQRGPNGKPIVK